MKQWWQNLTQREQRLVMAGAALIGLTLLWQLVWKPLVGQQQFLQDELATAQQINTTLQQRHTTQQGSASAAPDTSGNLHSTVTSTLKQYQLDGRGVSSEEKDEHTVRLKLEAKPFDQLVQFLSTMERQHAAHASSMTLTPTKDAGLVDAEITLER